MPHPAEAVRELLGTTVMQAPLGGGPGTVALAAAVGEGGGFGFLAAGYKSAAGMAEEIGALRRASSRAFGVNVFVPRPSSVEPAVLDAYLRSLEPDAKRLGVSLGDAAWDEDEWDDKLEVLLGDPVPLVSFTFGAPSPGMVERLQRAGTMVTVTVTCPEEASHAVAIGVDALVAQGVEAGGHQGRWNDHAPARSYGTLDLVRAISPSVRVPVLAAGGLMTGADVAAVVAAGAAGGVLGTAFLCCPEAGTNAVYRRCLAEGRGGGTGGSGLTGGGGGSGLTGETGGSGLNGGGGGSGLTGETALTRSFSGRWARGLVNQFMADHPDAPAAYPEINNATRPLRQAAVARDDPDRLHLWAGTGCGRVQVGVPAAALVGQLVEECRVAGE